MQPHNVAAMYRERALYWEDRALQERFPSARHSAYRTRADWYHQQAIQVAPPVRYRAPHDPQQGKRGHKLLSEEAMSALPPLYSGEEAGLDAKAIVKIFHPLSRWTWYASEYDPRDKLFFGLVVGLDVELGYFSYDELAGIGAAGRTLPVERDLHYIPETFRAIREREAMGGGY